MPYSQKAFTAKRTESKLAQLRSVHETPLHRSLSQHVGVHQSSPPQKVRVKVRVIVLVQKDTNFSHTKLSILLVGNIGYSFRNYSLKRLQLCGSGYDS